MEFGEEGKVAGRGGRERGGGCVVGCRRPKTYSSRWVGAGEECAEERGSGRTGRLGMTGEGGARARGAAGRQEEEEGGLGRKGFKEG